MMACPQCGELLRVDHECPLTSADGAAAAQPGERERALEAALTRLADAVEREKSGGLPTPKSIALKTAIRAAREALRADAVQPGGGTEGRTDWWNTGAPFCPRCGYPDEMGAPENQSPLAKALGARPGETT